MRIGIIGAGKIGGTIAKLFVQAGHEIALCNCRGPQTLTDMIGKLGPKARATTVEQAAKWGELIFLAIPWRLCDKSCLQADWVKNKVVIDATNPYTEDGGLIDLKGKTSSEEVQKWLPGCRLVKAFNTIYWEHLAAEGRPDLPIPQRRAVFVAGDDKEARQIVSRLIEQIGFAPVDCGSLREGGLRLEPGAAVYNRDITAQQAQSILAGA